MTGVGVQFVDIQYISVPKEERQHRQTVSIDEFNFFPFHEDNVLLNDDLPNYFKAIMRALARSDSISPMRDEQSGRRRTSLIAGDINRGRSVYGGDKSGTLAPMREEQTYRRRNSLLTGNINRRSSVYGGDRLHLLRRRKSSFPALSAYGTEGVLLALIMASETDNNTMMSKPAFDILEDKLLGK